MKKLIACLLAIWAMLSLADVYARHKIPFETSYKVRMVSGVITDEKTKEPLSGASVQIKGSTQGVTTDANGRFSINVADDKVVLVVSYSGYTVQEIKVRNQTTLNIQLSKEVTSLNEVVVVGYGTQKKGEVTSAIASVKSDDFTQGFARDAGQLIQGKVAGVSIATTSGDPTETTQIQLRGMNSILGSSTPLVLIDGVPGSLSTVAPEDIESIDVLKDGSAAAIYGTRGTNGVILITTVKRRGANKPPTLTYNGYVSVQTIARKMEFLDAADYRRLISQGVKGFNQDKDPAAGGYSSVAGTNDEFGATTDWFDVITRTPVSHTHNLTLQGGNAQTSYTASANLRDWQGLFLRSNNQQLVARVDLNHAMFDGKLKFNVGLISRSRKNFDGPNYNYIYRQALIRNPTEPIYTPTGNWFERSVYFYDNPLRPIEETEGEERNSNLRLNGSVTFSPIRDLNMKLLLSSSKSNGLTGYYETWNHRSSVDGNRPGSASRSTSFGLDELLEYTTDYTKRIADHRFTLLGGYSYQYSSDEGFGARNSNFPSDLFTYHNLGAGDAFALRGRVSPLGSTSMNSNKEDWKLIGFFGRLNYTWKDKYMVMASLRHEGSSKFGKNYRWGNFPAVSLGWRINKESFMEGVKLFNDLKLRAGYGVTGTIPNDPYRSLITLSYGRRFLYNGTWIQQVAPTSNPNPDLRWEKKLEWNLGVDFALLNNRISGSVDAYQRDTRDMLYNYQVPTPPYLSGSMLYNAAEMRNSGIEVLLNVVAVKKKDFDWKTSVTYSTNKNTLLSLNADISPTAINYLDAGYTGEPIQQSTHRNYVGGPIGTFYGWKSVDIAPDSTWIIESADGKPKSIDDATDQDKKVLGNGVPKQLVGWNNSFRYKQWDLNINMRGAFDYQILNFQKLFYGNPKVNQYNMLKSAFDPVYGKTPIYADLAYVSYYIEPGDHMKIDNVSLGYTFKVKGSKVVKNARLYVSALNLYTITGYSGIDPEVNRLGLAPGNDERDKYPTTRTFTFGGNFTF
jgi:TonB-dependent starch-binding outer membrane protein SusC